MSLIKKRELLNIFIFILHTKGQFFEQTFIIKCLSSKACFHTIWGRFSQWNLPLQFSYNRYDRFLKTWVTFSNLFTQFFLPMFHLAQQYISHPKRTKTTKTLHSYLQSTHSSTTLAKDVIHQTHCHS